MPRQAVPLHAADVSSFAKSLVQQIAQTPQPLGHLQWLNMLARAAGHRNFQSLRAHAGAVGLATGAPAPGDASPAALTDTAAKALRQFDDHGRLTRWPIKHSVQRVMLWGLWLRFDARRKYSEREVNAVLNAWHLFGDHCTLRRELIEMRLLERKPDGSAYRKVAARPEPETAAFLRALRARRPASRRRSGPAT